MDLVYNPKKLMVVEYPGTVVNVDNMTKTLGGEKTLFTAFQNPSKRLELRFRPDDPFCKCAHGDRFNTTNILLKVVKRTKKRAKQGDPPPEPEFKVEMLGVAATTYKFKAVADFQLLPVIKDKVSGMYKSLLPDLVPTTLHSADWLEQDVELFIPPILFSRFDLPQNAYAESQYKGKVSEAHRNLPPNVIGRGRKRRAGFAVFATFEGTEPIDSPQPDALKQLKTHPLDIEVKKKLDILFQERPVWSKNGLMLRLKCERCKLKYPLPCVAYYFTNGPWRALWVRFGYDPRKDPASKIYQIMDLRINPAVPINENKSRPRPAYYALPNKSATNSMKVATINTQDLVAAMKDDMEDDDDDDEELETKLRLASEYFHGQLPTARQCFYQLCDIHYDVVQELVHKNDGKELLSHNGLCHERDGWCELGILEKCRNILIADIIQTSKDSKNSDVTMSDMLDD